MQKIWYATAILAYGFLTMPTANGQPASNPASVSPVSVSIGAPASVIAAVTESTMSVRGTAAAALGVARVTWQTSNGVTGTASGTSAWVASGIPVPVGNTTIVIRAYDVEGSSAWVALVAVRQASATPTPTVISSAAKLPPPPAL